MTTTDPQTPQRTTLGALVQVAFFLSGATGLIYETVWLRVLATAYGNTTLATSVVLTAFMGGLGLGSLLGGRRADLVRRPFRLYAGLEIGVAVYCFSSLWLLQGVREAYLAAARRTAFDNPLLAALQFALTVLVLVIPTALMGATLPAVTRGFVRRVDQVGAAVANLYGINTFGAVVGVALAGFVMLPLIGLRAATWGAAAVNLAIGLAILLVERAAAGGPRPAAAERPSEEAPPLAARLNTVLLVGFGLSGMAALMLEVAWTRAIVMMIGSSIYAFTSILVAVLAGIALGSLAVGRIWGRRPMSPLWFGSVEAMLGLSCLAVSWLLGHMPFAFLAIFRGYRELLSQADAPGYAALVAVQLGAVLVALAVPTLLMGATMPILSRVYINRSGQVGTLLGRAYAANTLGAIVGSFSAGYLLIPLIGVRHTILLASAVYAAVGVAVLLVASARRRWPRVAAAATAAATAAALVLLPSWSRTLLSAGVFFGYGEIEPDVARLEFYKEGPVCTVAVFDYRSPDVITLVVNGKTDASTGEDMGTQLGLAHLPLLLADHARSVLIIGLGSGITAGAAARHPVERIDVVEIEPAVAQAATYFAQANRGVLQDPRFTLFLGDARSYIASTTTRYDVISSEPSNPWIAGIGSLFTVEHFRDCRRLLTPGGVMCQWIHGNRLGTDDLATVVRSFLAVFPHATLWTTGTGGDFLILGAQTASVPYERIRRRMAEIPAFAFPPESTVMPSAATVVARLVLGPDDLARFARRGRLNTDLFPVLEFSAPRSLYSMASYGQNVVALAAALRRPPTDLLDMRGSGLTYPELVARLVPVRLHEECYPLDEASRMELRRVIAARPDDAEAHYLLGLVLARLGDESGARRELQTAVRLAPGVQRYRDALQPP